MHEPEIVLDPSAEFALEVLDDGPRDASDYSFASNDAGLSSPREALLVRVVPQEGEPWVGRFEGGYPSSAAVTTLRSGPTGNELVVVNKGAGWLVPIDDPASALALDLGPIVAIALSPDDNLVVVADFTHLAAFGPEGRRWTAEVSWDGVELSGVQDGVVKGQGWDAPKGRNSDFAVEVRTGSVLRGVTPRP
ncbi:MAG: hypothetical protein QOH73_1539 [Gaiellaceae bacterium]|jgi:hypothetical protein|nr:hypothetical protein [Gaiellaceae bacterium]